MGLSARPRRAARGHVRTPSVCCARPGHACVTPARVPLPLQDAPHRGACSPRRHGRARGLLTDLESQRHPAYTLMELEILLARACFAASEGSTTEALAAAHMAADCPPWLVTGVRVLALHTALELGDHTVAGRLFELAGTVEGERAPTAALQAEALATGDGDGLLAAADRWEELGDRLAAADAAASAALVFRRQGRRGSDSTAVARAQRLRDACEGAHTPALTAAARPLPPDRARTRDSHPGRTGPCQPGDRRPARRLGSHGRGAHLPHLQQARRERTQRAQTDPRAAEVISRRRKTSAEIEGASPRMTVWVPGERCASTSARD